MATQVLRARNILAPAPAPQRIRAAAAHRRAAGSDSHHHPGATRRRSPPAGTSSPAAGRRHHGRRARPAVAAEVYAGPAFSTSPDPSSLPLPQFPTRKAVAAAAAAAVDAAATRDLRLILRLE